MNAPTTITILMLVTFCRNLLETGFRIYNEQALVLGLQTRKFEIGLLFRDIADILDKNHFQPNVCETSPCVILPQCTNIEKITVAKKCVKPVLVPYYPL